MGLLNLNYDKAGPGVSKNRAKKRKLFVFFEIWGRKFWQILSVNYIFLLSVLPICGLVLLFGLLFGSFGNTVLGLYLIFLPLSLLSFPLLGMTFICRNFVREEHSFLFHDFFDQMKKNLKQTLLHGFVSYTVAFFGVVAVRFYWIHQDDSGFIAAPLTFSIILLLFFLIMQYYIFTMILTFELPYLAIVKNAFIFIFAGFLRNIILSIFIIPIWGLLIDCLLSPFFDTSEIASKAILFPIPFILLGLCGFTCFVVCFVTYPLICKYLIEPVYGEKAEQENIDLGPKSTDHYHPLEGTEEPEYVYVNGRLIKRDDSEKIFEDEVK